MPLPPTPGLPRPVLIARFVARPTQLLADAHRRYGDYFTFGLTPGRTVVITADPAAVRQVFTGDPNTLLAGEANVVLRPLLGSRSVLLLDGPEHLRQRRLLLPPFHGERMKRYGALMAEVAGRHIAAWPADRPFAVAPTMQAITLEVILRAVFGVTEPARLDALGGRLRAVLDATAGPARMLALQVTSSANPRPRSPWGRMKARLAAADDLIFDEIRARRAEPHERDDILSLLLAARDEDGRALSDRELRDELMTLLVAGHETTATALAWTIERLARHPDKAERAAADGAYLDAVVKETLRLRPVVPAVVRKLTEPQTFGPWDLPAGVHIAPSIYLLHRRPDLYPEPEAFRPERFLERAPGTYEWIPFGGGIRRCLGASFALFEMRVVLQTVLAQLQLAPDRAEAERVTRRAITFTPARGGRVSVSARPAEPARLRAA